MAPLDIYLVTFNCGRKPVDEDAFAACIFNPYQKHEIFPDIIVLSLQEIAPIAYSFLGGSNLVKYTSRIVKAVKNGASKHQIPLRHFLTRHVGMTTIIILVKPETRPHIQWAETAGVGVGLWEMGNKGAVGARIGYMPNPGERAVELTFVAAHLAPMEDGVRRRNLDWENIVRDLVFMPAIGAKSHVPTKDASDTLGESEPLLSKNETAAAGIFLPGAPVFLAADLNYRTSDSGPSGDAYKTFPQPCVSVTDAQHFSQLFKTDQLMRERQAGRTCHLLTEEVVNFPPTYKYSDKQQKLSSTVDPSKYEEPSSWDWAKHRYPSWCDRILFSSYLTSQSNVLKVLEYTALPIQPTSDHRPVALALQIDVQSLVYQDQKDRSDTNSPFPLNVNWRQKRAAARRKELVVGVLAYLSLTWRGNGLIFIFLMSCWGIWTVTKTLMNY